MKIISSTQLKELDKYTIAKEPVASIDLMERAAEELTRAITHRWDTSFHIAVFAGPGNNGGDALAVARMLSKQNYHVEVFLFNTKGKLSEECQTNLERLKECGSVYFTEVSTQFDPPVLTEKHLVVDGLFGSGLNKPLNGGFAAVVKYINASKAQVVAFMIPSGVNSTCEAALLSFSFTAYALSGSGMPMEFTLILFISQCSSGWDDMPVRRR